MAGHGDPGAWAGVAVVVVVAVAWDVSSCSLTGAMAASGTTDQHRQYGRNGRNIKILIL